MTEAKQSNNRIKYAIISVGITIALASIGLDVFGLSASGLSFNQIVMVAVGLIITILPYVYKQLTSIYQTVAVLLLNAVIIVLILEFGASVYDYVDYRYLGRNNEESIQSAANPEVIDYYQSQDWGIQYLDEQARYRPNWFEYGAYSLWVSPTFTSSTINTREGRRITTNIDCESEDAYTIYLFGGSTMWGLGVPDDYTIPSLLAEILTSGHNTSFCLVNYSQLAYVHSQSAIVFGQLLRQGHEPDLAIFYDGFNDINSAFINGNAYMHYSMPLFIERLSNENRQDENWLQDLATVATKHSEFVQLLTPATTPEATNVAATFDDVELEQLSDDTLANYGGNLGQIEALVEPMQTNVVFFWQPTIPSIGKQLTSHEQYQKDKLMSEGAHGTFDVMVNLRLSEIQADNFYDLTNTFDDIEEAMFVDRVHLTHEGNQLIAEAIYDIIKSTIENDLDNR